MSELRAVWLQAALAVLAAVLLWAAPLVGVVGLLGLAAAWPPAVPWLPLRLPAVLRSCAVVLPAFAAVLVGYLWLARALGAPVAPQPALREFAVHGMAAPDAWANAFLIVIAAPFVEEILFRGYLLTALHRTLPAAPAQIVCAAAFGLAHGLEYALPVGLLGWWFGWLRLRHGALLPAIAAHLLHNGTTLALTVAWPAHFDWLYPT